MKILHCIPSLAAGGAERQCVRLCIAQKSRGHEVHAAYVLAGIMDFVADLEQAGVTLHRLGEGLVPDIWRAQKSPRVAWRLWRLIRKLRPRIVQSWNRPMDTFVGLLARFNDIRWVLSENNSGFLYRDGRERLRVWAAGRAGAIAANSLGGADYWRENGMESSRIHVVPNPIAGEELRNDASPCDWPDQLPPNRTVLYVGRFAWQKNIPVMLESLRQVVAGQDAFALLCGTGELLEEAKSKVRRWGLGDRIVFAGYAVRPWQLMKRAAMLVSVSLCEGHPNVVAEAIAVGCPLVVSDIPAHREFLDESKACIVQGDSPRAVADGVREVLKNPGAARDRARRAMAMCEQWSPDRVAARLDEIYATLGGGTGAGQ